MARIKNPRPCIFFCMLSRSMQHASYALTSNNSANHREWQNHCAHEYARNCNCKPAVRQWIRKLRPKTPTQFQPARYQIMTRANETICKMLNIDSDTLNHSAELLKAMAHPERLRLLRALCDGEQCVCHLTAVLGQRQPYVSQQLAYLRDAGILTDRKVGLRVYYRLTDYRVVALLKALEVYDPAPAQAEHCACPQCLEKAKEISC